MKPQTPAQARNQPDEQPPKVQRLPLELIVSVETPEQAEAAMAEILAAKAVGFDTESKPTFVKGAVQTGPHLFQFALGRKAWLFQTRHPAAFAAAKSIIENPSIEKVGFGMAGDGALLRTNLGIEAQSVVDLSAVLRAPGERSMLGAKSASLRYLGAEFPKSKRDATSDWSAAKLSDRQRLYAGNDAWISYVVWDAWTRSGPIAPPPAEAAERKPPRP